MISLFDLIYLLPQVQNPLIFIYKLNQYWRTQRLLGTSILIWAPQLNAQLKKKRTESSISFLIEFSIRDCKGSMHLCLHFVILFKHNTQKGCIIHHICYRPCVATSLAIAWISECILSMKYNCKKRCVQINIRIPHWLVLVFL